MTIFLHNTLTGKKEEFKPLVDGQASMYNCGPTVYNYAHIGNLRSYVFADTLRRVLEWNGYQVRQVINITDIGHLSSDADEGEDKMTKALKREGKPLTLTAMREVADQYFGEFQNDLSALNIEPPAEFPFASDHIEDDIALIEILSQKSFTYRTSDGIYFETDKFPGYGKLGNIAKQFESDDSRSRVGENPEKKSQRDFALWKFNPKLGFEAPFGRGFPGWHIECSAMSKKYLGQPFDIHTGGIDHIPTHHNDEIAQSEAAYGLPLANFWMHNAHLNMGGEKMAKSGENFLRLETLRERSIDPLAYRYLLLTARYSSPIQFSWEALDAAQTAWKFLRSFMSSPIPGVSDPHNPQSLERYKNDFTRFINDDLDTPKALALVRDMIKDKLLFDADKQILLKDFDRVLGLGLDKVDAPIEVPDEVQNLIVERDKARSEKDFARSDALRVEIESLGFEVKDTPEGTRVSKK